MMKNVMKLFRDLMKLGKVETEQGVLIYEGDVLAEGTEVYVEDEAGNIVPAPDGQYGEYIVKDGRIAPKEEASVEEAPAQEVEESQEEVKQEEEVPAETPDYEKRFEALEAEIADLRAALAELKKEKEDMEFSAMKPAEKEIKDFAAKDNKKGAMKYFE